jgi:hypothetical protein
MFLVTFSMFAIVLEDIDGVDNTIFGCVTDQLMSLTWLKVYGCDSLKKLLLVISYCFLLIVRAIQIVRDTFLPILDPPMCHLVTLAWTPLPPGVT